MASMDKGGGGQAKLILPPLQSRQPCRTDGAVIGQVRAGKAIEEAIDVLLE